MSLPALYTIAYEQMKERAQGLGYALALHGSMNRDLDVIAVPWTREAVDAEALAGALIEISGGNLHPLESDEHFRRGMPGMKPHGRLVWSIYLDGKSYVDLSVMPRKEDDD